VSPVPEIEPGIRNLKPSGSLTNVGALVLGLGSPSEEKLGSKAFVDYDTVPIETIDSLGLERLDLIKIDAQGFEARVLKGGAQTIKKYLPDIYMEYGAYSIKYHKVLRLHSHLGACPHDRNLWIILQSVFCTTDVHVHPPETQSLDLYHSLKAISDDYKCYHHRPPLFKESNFNKWDENMFGVMISFNVLCGELPASSTTSCIESNATYTRLIPDPNHVVDVRLITVNVCLYGLAFGALKSIPLWALQTQQSFRKTALVE
jgi:hypothetical protein